MLIEILEGVLGLAPGVADTIFDMSVGYDLAGISPTACAPSSAA